MKKLLYILSLFISTVFMAQGSINFENSTFKDILAKAKKEKKIIFMDAFASWCGPCKMMEKNVFPKDNVKKYYNENFINARFDMEKGEGREIAQKYLVRSYPTFLFLNGDGEVVFKGMGYLEENDFLAMGKEANNPFSKEGGIKERFEKGESDPEFLKNIIKTNANSDMEFAKKASERYFKVKKNKEFSQEEISMLLYFLKSTDDVNYQVFKNSKAEIIKYLPENIYNQLDSQLKLSKVIEKSVDYDKKTINDTYFLTEATKLVGAQEAQDALYRLQLNYYSAVKNFAKYEKAALAYYKDGEGFNSTELLQASLLFSEFVSDLHSLNKAKIWAEKVVMSGETAENTYILAKIYLKTGDKEKAKMFAQQSASIAKKEGKNSLPAETLMAEIK